MVQPREEAARVDYSGLRVLLCYGFEEGGSNQC